MYPFLNVFECLRRCPKIVRLIPIIVASFAPTFLSATAKDEAPQFHPCARTATYKYFEKVQYDAYASDPVLYQQLVELQNADRVLKTIHETGRELDTRDNPLGAEPLNNPKTDKFIRDSLKHLKLQTCYENPMTFFLLQSYQKQIELSRCDSSSGARAG